MVFDLNFASLVGQGDKNFTWLVLAIGVWTGDTSSRDCDRAENRHCPGITEQSASVLCHFDCGLCANCAVQFECLLI
jgi:hypothetical protein